MHQVRPTADTKLLLCALLHPLGTLRPSLRCPGFHLYPALFVAQSTGANDVIFCERMTKEAGVTLIPVSAFYEDAATAPRTLVRFVFCKTDAKLEAACDALEEYFSRRRCKAAAAEEAAE